MTVITNATARARTGAGWLTAARRTLTELASSGAKKANKARARYRRTALQIGGLGCIAASAFQVNLGVGLLVTGLLAFVFEWLGGDE